MSQKATETLLEGGGGVSFATFLAILRKRLWMIAAFVVAVPMLVGFVVSKQPKVYQATASVIVDSTVPQYLGQQYKDVVDIETSWWSAQELLQTELKVMKSYAQAYAVADSLCRKDTDRPESELAPITRLMSPSFDCTSKKDMDRAALLLQAMITVVPVRESRVVNITTEFHDADMVALVANRFAAVYINRNLERRLSQSSDAADWLKGASGGLSTDLTAAENRLWEFKKKNNVVAVSLEDLQNDLSSRRRKISDELGQVQVKLIGVKVMRDEYDRLKTLDPTTEIRPGVADNPMIIKLKGLYFDEYAKLYELRGKYGDKHPTLLAHEDRLHAIKADLAHEAEQAQKAVEAQYVALGHQERDLRAALDTSTRESLALEQKAIEYNRLKREFDRLVKVSDQVGGREHETSLAGHLKTNNVRPLDAALIPKAPVAPNVLRAIAVSAAVALILAIGLAFLLELLDSTVKTQDDVEQAAGLVFLGLIPRITTTDKAPGVVPPAVADLVKAGSPDLHVLAYPRSSVAECCRAIRTNILFMTPDKPAKSLLVTSAGPREGKTTTAISLAITIAQSGQRVCIIDTDMRRPRLHKAFGIPAGPDGISRAIVGDCEVMTVVRETGVPNLWVLPCGPLPPNPAELLHAERFKKVVADLEANFDRLIFDSPPVGAVTDGSILSRTTSGVVLVAKSGETSKDTLGLLARRLFADGSVNVLGCILNDLDLNKMNAKGYYQYYAKYGYYSGYGEEVDTNSKPASA